jgi:hypothetical protein
VHHDFVSVFVEIIGDIKIEAAESSTIISVPKTPKTLYQLDAVALGA